MDGTCSLNMKRQERNDAARWRTEKCGEVWSLKFLLDWSLESRAALRLLTTLSLAGR
jgi:hypothetical protein